MKLQEKDLEFHFQNVINAMKFDQMESSLPNYHGIDEMHRVDFIVELENSILFVEIKDPECPNCTEESKQKFYTKIQNGKIYDTFASKFIDTFLYRWAEEELTKPIHYISLVTGLDEAQTLNFAEQIEKKLPPLGKNVPRWKKKLFNSCLVFNFETWNAINEQWPVIRVSQSGAQ